MVAIVVYAHPSEESFTAALRDAAVAGLERAGKEVVLHDLYADGFEPRMSAEERVAYDTDNPVVHPQIRRYADDLQRADTLVFVYPTWWWGVPAILKGWFDRSLVPGEALLLERSFGPPRPGFQQITRIVGITTYGSSRWVLRLQPDGGRRMIRRALRFLCSYRLRTIWLPFYGSESSTLAERQAFLTRIETTLADL